MRVRCTVNGEQRVADDVWAGESLLYVLRERLGLPGSKDGCGKACAGRARSFWTATDLRVSGAGGQPEGRRRHGRGAGRGGASRPGAAGLRRGRRGPVRVLHARPGRRRARPASATPTPPTPTSGRRWPGTCAGAPATRRSSTRCGWPRRAREAPGDHGDPGMRRRDGGRQGTEYADGHVVVEGTGSRRSAPARRTLGRGRATRAGRPRLPRHARPGQHPSPPLPVDDPRARPAGRPVRLADHALPGLGGARRGRRRAPPPRPGSAGWRCPAAPARPTTTTCSRVTAATCWARRSTAARDIGLRFHPTRGSMDLGQSPGRAAAGHLVETTEAALAGTRVPSTSTTIRRPARCCGWASRRARPSR